MAINVSVDQAEEYFGTNVLFTDEWDSADYTKKEKALTNAENQLYRYYSAYNATDKPVPNEAVFEQALWLLRLDDSIRKAEQGVRQISVSGVTIAIDRAPDYIAPEVRKILGRRVGWSVL
jgi:hypothetical protein